MFHHRFAHATQNFEDVTNKVNRLKDPERKKEKKNEDSVHITLRTIHSCADVPFALNRQPGKRLPHSSEEDKEVGAYGILLRPLPRHRKRTDLLGPRVGPFFESGLPSH